MAQANSRAVDAVANVAPFNAPYPQLDPGYNIFGADNETTPLWGGGPYHNLDTSNLPLGTSVENIPRLGTEVRTWDGRVFRYVYNDEAATAIAQGNTVMADTTQTNADATITTTTILTDPPRVVTTTSLTAGAEVGHLFYIDEGGGAGQTRTIVANTTDTIYFDRPLDTATSATSDFTIIPMWHVLQGTDGGKIIGIMPFPTSITAGNYGWIQTRGICEAALIGDGGVTADDRLTTDITAGSVGVYGATEAETLPSIGVALVTAAATELAPIWIGGDCIG